MTNYDALLISMFLLLDRACRKDDPVECALEALAFEIRHLYPRLERDMLSPGYLHLGNCDPGLLPVFLKKGIGVSAAIHRLHNFAGYRRGFLGPGGEAL